MQSFSSTFTQANGAVSSPPWTALASLLQVRSNHIEAPTNSENYQVVWSTPCDTQKQYSEIVQTLGNSGVGYSDVEVTCRSSNSVESFYAFLWASSGGTCTYELWKAVSGTWTMLDSAAAATSGTKTIRIEADGTTIRGLVDGVEVCSATDSSLTGSYVGINIFRDNGTTSQGDNWAAGDIASSIPSGSGSGSFNWVGNAVGKRKPKATGTGGFNWAGSSVGEKRPLGVGSGTYNWSGSASGEMPSINSGFGSGLYQWLGTATGSSPNKGEGSGVRNWAGSAVGERKPVGVGAGNFQWQGFAVGSNGEEGGVNAGVIAQMYWWFFHDDDD